MDEARERLYLQRIAEDAARAAQEAVGLQVRASETSRLLEMMTKERDDLARRLEAIEAQSAPAQEAPPAAE